MRFLTALASVATMVAATLAQDPIAFTSVPTDVAVGEVYEITWVGGDPELPVTLTLRRGDPQDLQTISTLTSDATGGSYSWTPDATLSSGDDYALQISQGESDINFSGLFTITGGTAPTSSSTDDSTMTTMPPSALGTGMPFAQNSTMAPGGTGALGNATSMDAPVPSPDDGMDIEDDADTDLETVSGTDGDSAPGDSETELFTGGTSRLASSMALVVLVTAALAFSN